MIAVGVDTHKHEHVARALDGLGQLVGGLQIKANLGGYVELLGWLRSFDDDVVVGIEGAGSYGAGLCELLLAEGIRVVRVSNGHAARTADAASPIRSTRCFAQDGLSTPRAGHTRQALQTLLVAYRSCISERTRLLNQLQALHTTEPVALRERVGPGDGRALVTRLHRMRARQGAPEARAAHLRCAA